MNDIDEEINEIGQLVISVIEYIYFMSDIIMPVRTHGYYHLLVCEICDYRKWWGR